MVTTDIAIDPSNRAAFQAWNEEEGDYWADNDDLYDAGLARYDPAFFAAAGVAPTDRVLDIGCGNGSTTCEAARRAPHGTALGVDLSARMIERARARATVAGLANVQFLQADAQIYPFPVGVFDQVISRTGVMFFGDPATAFCNIGRSLRRSGRLTLLVWQDDDHNPWIADLIKAVSDRPPPTPDSAADSNRMSFDRPDQVEMLLTRSGFVDITFDPLSELLSFGPDTETAFRFARGIGFIMSMISALHNGQRPRALNALRQSLGAHTVADGVLYPSAMWLISGRRA
jgi:SAM-dependent methyltransferase